MDSSSISMGSERRGKVRGNRDSTLPIEDWAKGLSRAFSRRKSTAVKPSRPKVLETIQDVPVVQAPQRNSVVFPPRTSSMGNSPQILKPTPELNKPIEDWMKTLPQRRPTHQARSPKRVSLYDRPMTSTSFATSNGGSDSSPLDSASIPTDWSSDYERELPLPNPYYEKCLNKLVDASSNIQVSEIREATDKISPLPSSQVSREKLDLTAATSGVKQASLRSLFFPGSQAKEGPRTLSVTSSDVIGRDRALSIASSSVESFATANDGSEYAVEDDIQEEVDNNDTGIDEDYTKKDDSEDAEIQYVYTDTLWDQKIAQETIIELQNADQNSEAGSYSHEGTLEDVLVQVALSSPYASSESDISSRNSFSDASTRSETPESPIDASSDISKSLPDTDSVNSPISFSSGSIVECQRVRPAKHYKLINGLIVQYDPWRIPGQFNVSRYPSSQSTGSDIAPSISDRSFDRSRFVSAANRWSYMGAPMAMAA